MESFLKEYVRKYNRIVIISDHKSHIASDILYEGIVNTMKDLIDYKNKLHLIQNPKLYKFHTYDEFDDNVLTTNYGIPRRMVFDNFFKQVQNDDIFVLRCTYYNRITPGGYGGSVIHSTPTKVGFNAELIIGTVNNKLTIVKDRYGFSGDSSIYDGYDLRNLSKSYKLKKILDRINS